MREEQERSRRALTLDRKEDEITRESILERRSRRKRQIEVMLLSTRQKLSDHASGEKILTAEDKDKHENQIDLYQRKIESMEV